MAWIKIDRGLVAHKKIARLSARMKWNRMQSIGFMTSFWVWAAENCCDGQMGDMGDMDIAFAVSMDSGYDGLKDAMISSGFLDTDPLKIHDWYTHQYEYLRSKYRRDDEKLAAVHAMYQPCTGTAPVQDRYCTAPDKEEKRREEKRKREETTICAFQAEFVQFWAAYPRKVGRGGALKAWEKAKPPLAKCLSTLAWQCKSDQWQKDGGQFIPMPATWINQARWQDVPDTHKLVVCPDCGHEGVLPKNHSGALVCSKCAALKEKSHV